MTHFPSGLGAGMPEQVDDPRAWLARVLVAIDEQPLGYSAPCANPECGGPVDYTGRGEAPLYCGARCRNRAVDLRRSARQQLDVIDGVLAATKHLSGVPRDDLHARSNLLRWWLARLPTRAERVQRD